MPLPSNRLTVDDEVHAWLGNTDSTSRVAWHRSLQRIRELHLEVVVAGDTRDVNAVDSPETVAAMEQYLTIVDSLRTSTASAPELVRGMVSRFPTHVMAGLLRISAQSAYPQQVPPFASRR